jgi:hypothetical protein
MTRALAWILAAVAFGVSAIASTDVGAAADFKRGATIVEFFNFPATLGDGPTKRYANPAYPRAISALSLFDLGALRQMGFDHMRVPVNLGPLMHSEDTQRSEIIRQLQTVIAALHRNDLAALVTLYPPSLHGELPETHLDHPDGPKFRAYVAMVKQVATALADIKSGKLALEPMNEPQTACQARSGFDWTSYQEIMIRQIRQIAPDLNLLLTGGCWSNIEGIVLLDSDLLRDRRNFVSVHFYYPFLFTHQTATWTSPHMSGVIGISYPSSAGNLVRALSLTRERFKTATLPSGVDRKQALARAERDIRWYFNEGQGALAVDRWMKRVAEWQARQTVASDRIVFTEFGAMKQLLDGVEIDRDSRMRWLRDASAAIARFGWGWTVYVLRDGPYGIYDSETDRFPDPRLLAALGLTPLVK